MAPPISTLGLQKAAILMVLLGEESASHIYRNLPEGDVERLPEEVRAETVKRLAQLRQFSPEVAQKVALSLNKHLESLGEQSRRAYAGFKGAADLLNQLEPISSK